MDYRVIIGPGGENAEIWLRDCFRAAEAELADPRLSRNLIKIRIIGADSAIRALNTDRKTELTTAASGEVCRPAHKYLGSQLPLIGMSELCQRG